MAAILTVQGGIIMQNRQIDGHGVYLSLLAGLAVLCLAAALVWFTRPQPETAAPRYLLKDAIASRIAAQSDTSFATGPI